MFNRFKINETVIVNGIGKCNNTEYTNQIAVIICRDPYFLDYNVRFQDDTEDWLDGKFLRKVKKDNQNENKLC